MSIDERILAFSKLGNYIRAIDKVMLEELLFGVRNRNAWFTGESVGTALKGLITFLDQERLTRWTNAYPKTGESLKWVALVMAGNIPMVGFHDLLAVLISGNRAMIKLSSRDSILIPYLTEALISIEPRFQDRISYVEQMKDFDAVIATGSDNSARYFEYYFAKYPNIIRKNRTSCAVLIGNETADELHELGTDIFTYFGLGCRNVSKIYVPQLYNFNFLMESIESFNQIIHHHKYNNNYDYQKSIMLVNSVPFLDNGFLMLNENEKFVSPISVLFYEYYQSLDVLKEKLNEQRDKIQCIVGKSSPATVSFGQAQFPELWDYADQVDTLRFLTELH